MVNCPFLKFSDDCMITGNRCGMRESSGYCNGMEALRHPKKTETSDEKIAKILADNLTAMQRIDNSVYIRRLDVALNEQAVIVAELFDWRPNLVRDGTISTNLAGIIHEIRELKKFKENHEKHPVPDCQGCVWEKYVNAQRCYMCTRNTFNHDAYEPEVDR